MSFLDANWNLALNSIEELLLFKTTATVHKFVFRYTAKVKRKTNIGKMSFLNVDPISCHSKDTGFPPNSSKIQSLLLDLLSTISHPNFL